MFRSYTNGSYTLHLNICSFRKIWPAFFFLLIAQLACATNDSLQIVNKKADYYIDDEQKRIDLLDGIADDKVMLRDSAATLLAIKTYFLLIDSFQRLADNPKFTEVKRKTYRETVYRSLRTINARSVLAVKKYEQQFRFIIGELNAIEQKRLLAHLVTNVPYALSMIELFREEPTADSFLIYASGVRPDLVFETYEMYAKKSYALHVLEEAAKTAPVTVKRYFNPNDKIYKALQKSNDTIVRKILEIKEKYSRKSNAFTLLDDIVSGKLSAEKANDVGTNSAKYLRAMLQIRTKKNPLAVHSLESELEIYSLKFVRVLNDLHNEKDEVRFASIEDFSAGEIYTLMVYSEEEIFTSTFNGLFQRLMVKLGPVSGFEFLNTVGDNRFRTFIKMAAGFGKLRQFLNSMTKIHQQMLMIKFVSGLEQYNNLSQAVEVADAFGSIADSLVLKILRGAIKLEYIRLSAQSNERGMAIYGLLSNLFVEKNVSSGDWFTSVAQQYAMHSFERITIDKLFDNRGVSRWLIYFYDDEDGEASFATFLKTFADNNWSVIDSTSYVLIKSKGGRTVHIYANKPKHEYDGQEKLEKIFSANNYEPNVMVHRGHSYYAFKTIEKIKDNTQVFVLGSCGGYHSISSILELSEDVSIISSKQIGTMAVNNPMLKIMAENIRLGKDVEWQTLWENLYEAVKDNPKAYERFLDYIPPHKNLGAIFIKTYNKITEHN